MNTQGSLKALCGKMTAGIKYGFLLFALIILIIDANAFSFPPSFVSFESFVVNSDEWGANESRQRANTKEEEESLGLLNENMRYRVLADGIFLTRDPAGFVDGPNLYQYVHCNPITHFDALGLATQWQFEWQNLGRNTAQFGKDFGTGLGNMAKGVAMSIIRPDLVVKGVAAKTKQFVDDPVSVIKEADDRVANMSDGGFFAEVAVGAGSIAGGTGAGRAGSKVAKVDAVVPDEAAPLSQAPKTTKLLTDGGRVPNAGGTIRSFVQESDQVYYRVFSENAQGSFLTATRPGSRAFAQEALALPKGNTASYIQDVLVPSGTRLQRSRALPAFGRRGGAEQFELLEHIPTQNFSTGVPFQ